MRYYLLCLLVIIGLNGFSQKNVIILIADDLGTDYCGFYPNVGDTANMPNVRSLVSKGVVFKNAWATPYCSSTRAGLLTGRYGFRTGVGTVITNLSSTPLDTGEMTIPKMLKKHSNTPYKTANVGKWHVQQQTNQSLTYPNIMGYDLYSGNFLGQLPDYYSWTRITNGVSEPMTTYATTQTVDDAISWLDTVNNKPFFLWLAFNAPHSPYHKPPDNLHTVPNLTGTAQDIQQHPVKYFKAMTEAMDTEIGRLISYLASHQKLDSTDFIFIGDNGNALKVAQIADSTKAKGTIYEYGVHVPFVISGPSVVNPNRYSNALVSTPDLFATALELMGVSDWHSYIVPTKPTDAVSIVPIVKNQASQIRNWDFTELFTPTPTINDGKTIRNLTYKLLNFDDGHQEFYNLSVDSLEENNLLSQASLTTVELSNYLSLCDTLSQLVGTTACNSSIDITYPTKTLSYTLYPNPAQQTITISLPTINTKPLTATIYNMFGQVLQSIPIITQTTKVELENLSSGMYFLEIEGYPNQKFWIMNY